MAGLLERSRRGEQHVDELIRKIRCRRLGADRHRHVVDLAVAIHHRHTCAHQPGPGSLELRAVGLEEPVQVPDHGVRVELGAVVEGDAQAQVEYPGPRVARRLFPTRGQAGPKHRWFASGRQVPQHQPLERGVAQETHALEAVVRRAGGGRHVRGRHRNPQRVIRGARLPLRQRAADRHEGGKKA